MEMPFEGRGLGAFAGTLYTRCRGQVSFSPQEQRRPGQAGWELWRAA